MTAADELSDDEIYLAELSSSDEEVEALLAAGADIDELIAAGVLGDDKAENGDVEPMALEFASIAMTEDEAIAWFNDRRQRLEASGHRRIRIRI